MTTYQITATYTVEAEDEIAALDTFVEALADGTLEPTFTVVPDVEKRIIETPEGYTVNGVFTSELALAQEMLADWEAQ